MPWYLSNPSQFHRNNFTFNDTPSLTCMCKQVNSSLALSWMNVPKSTEAIQVQRRS